MVRLVPNPRPRRGLISAASGRKLKAGRKIPRPRYWPSSGLTPVEDRSLPNRIAIGFSMSRPLTAQEILDREFLEIRSRVLELAAAFDRLERAEGSVTSDPRLVRLHEALQAVIELPEARAERVQMIFSRAYDENWQRAANGKPR
jgi:hypothetical protein